MYSFYFYFLTKKDFPCHFQDTIVHISATASRLLETAEEIELKKACTDGTMRTFDMDELEYFKGSGEHVLIFSMRYYFHSGHQPHPVMTSTFG
jgi:hypothetical protein